MKARHKRLTLVLGGMAILGLGVWAIATAFQQNLNYSYTPSEIVAGKAPQHHTLRIGGMVEEGTLKHEPDGLTWTFVVTDMIHAIPVTYRGILPDLFKEGKGVVAEGKLDGAGFTAEQVLAKHDENYMPPEAAYALKKAREAKAAGTQAGASASAVPADGAQAAQAAQSMNAVKGGTQ